MLLSKNQKLKRIIRIGNLEIGGNNRITIQSMTNIETKKISEVVKQIKSLENEGCDIIRVSVLDEEDALAIKAIKRQISIPLVADIHFDYKLALLSIEAGCDKLRINPGNIGSIDKIAMVVNACKEKKIPIRIGVNGGSLEKDILDKYQGVTAQGLVESVRRHVKILENLDFHDIVISIKTSNVLKCIEAYELVNNEFDYPLHIGITEAGTEFSGSIKSAIGLGILLNNNIGSTIRVSLSDDPIKEIRVAKEILTSLDLYKKPHLISCPTCGRTKYNMIPIVKEIEEYLYQFNNLDITIAIMGCVVNGPGEAREADLGIAGGTNCAVLFKKGEIIRKIPECNIVNELKQEILEFVNLQNKNK